jgi:hypothetical protein
MSGYLFQRSRRKRASLKIQRHCPFVLVTKLVWRQGGALGGEKVRMMGSGLIQYAAFGLNCVSQTITTVYRP